jgi:pyruvate/2-oxoglutarate dehydrogenase complex dihydrolipoamide dehydrogenase (E3) component
MSKIPLEHVRVVIVGAGPAGIGAAIGLAKRRVGPILLLDRWNKAGGIPAKYPAEPGGVKTYVSYTRGRVMFGQQFADRLLGRLAQTDVELRLESSVLEMDAERRQLTVVDPQRGKYSVSADAIVLATGAREETSVERGWIVGNRNANVMQTMQLLELLGRGKRLAWEQPIVAGSDLIAHAAAAKLKAGGAQTVRMFDTSARPQTSLPAQWYFRRWVRPEWQQQDAMVLTSTKGDPRSRQIQFPDGRQVPYDALVVSGQLVPNAELLVEAGLATKPPSHIPLTGSHGRLSSSGCFAVGNLLGGFRGGQWCYYNGLRVAKAVGSYFQANVES